MDVFFIFGLFVIAYMYASVGHGGASGYLALMAFYGVAPDTMKSSALILNLFVSLIAFIIFFKSGFFRWRLLLPFVIVSMPFAFLGAGLDISPSLYRKILAVCLLLATIKILLPVQNIQNKTSYPNIPVALFSGAIIGFVSGMIGIGGGIILSPLLIIAKWANIKESASISSAFIFLNSAAGLAGLYNSHSINVEKNFIIWIIVALLGGLTGSYFGAYRITFKWMKYILSLVLVLAGGESQRMGCDKGLLVLKNKKLIEYSVEILRQICNNIIISANTNAYDYLGLPVVPDIHESMGPISGVYSGLKESKTAQNIFLACDMPFVDSAILNILMQNNEEFDIIVPSLNNWPLPVCGFYNKSVLPVLESEINKGNFSLQGLLKICNSLVIEVEDESNRKKLTNINTREEFNKLSIDSYTRTS